MSESLIKSHESKYRFQYTALGDSIAFGIGATKDFGYVYYFKDFLEKLHHCVNLTNRAVPGNSSRSLLQQLLQDPVTRESVSNADLITISIGGANLLGCIDNVTDIDYGCANRGVLAFNHDWPQILNVIRDSIGSRARILVMNVYNPLTGISPNYDTIDDYIQQINYTIGRAEYRCRYDYQVVDVYRRFLGQFPDGTWKVCTWTHFCDPIPDPHPADSGHAKIAKLHEVKYSQHKHCENN